jgi:hypothetical protein
MNTYLRSGFLLVGLLAVALTIGFYFQIPAVTNLWMWQDGRLTYIFIASITAAIAAPVIWMGLMGEWGAVTGGALNLMIQSGGITLFLLQLEANDSERSLLPHIFLFGVFTLINTGLLVWSLRYPIKDQRRIPRLVYAAFVVSVALLTIVAVLLLLKQPNVFPWRLKPETSVVIGWVFAGTVLYFAYPLVRRVWGNVTGQLLGFLAYDLILILPFLNHFNSVQPEQRLSLIVYTAVVISSAMLAIFYLFIYKPTRITQRQ